MKHHLGDKHQLIINIQQGAEQMVRLLYYAMLYYAKMTFFKWL